MSQLGLATIYSSALHNGDVLQAGNTTMIGFMSIILFIIVAFVMFSLAFILIARFVFLIFLIILAPVGFAGFAIPQLSGMSKQWKDKLIEQTITAPVLLLLLYVALAVITDAHFLGFGTSKDWAGFVANGATTNLTGFASTILSFLVAMGLLLAVTIAAKKLSAFGAGWATKAGGKLSFGAVAFAGRRTVGRASNYAARKIRSSEFGRSETGRLLAGVADRGAKGSFDVRGTSALKNLPFGGVDAGAAQKGGYRAREDELVKARTDYAKTLRQSKAQKDATEEAEKIKREENDEKNGTHVTNMKPLQDAEQEQLKLTKETTDVGWKELALKQKELEEAHKFGNADQIRAAETEYNNKIHDLANLKEVESAKLDPIRAKIEAEKKRHETAIAEQNVIIKQNSTAAKEAAQEKYGEALQSGPAMKLARGVYDWPTAVGSARREAAGKIIGESKKDPSQKQMDRIEALFAKKEAKEGTEKKPDNAEGKPKE
jgi:hypothetical protein